LVVRFRCSGGYVGVLLGFYFMLVCFFVGLSLVPLFFLIGIWGGPQRQHAARKFFIYTLAGSVITLLGVLAVVLTCQARTDVLTFSIPKLVGIVQQQIAEDPAFWQSIQPWIFLALMTGFMIKVPLVP